MDKDPAVPREIGRSGERDIKIAWSDAHESVYPVRLLRLKCPCAMCVEETTGLRILREEEVPSEVEANSLQLVGRYGLRIWWNDGHSTGIYTFEYLRELCPCLLCHPASDP